MFEENNQNKQVNTFLNEERKDEGQNPQQSQPFDRNKKSLS